MDSLRWFSESGWVKEEYLWLLQVALVLLVTLVASALLRQILDRLQARFARTRTLWDDLMLVAARRPAKVAVWVTGLAWAVAVVEQATQLAVLAGVQTLHDLLIILLLIWFLLRLISGAESAFLDGERAESRLDATSAQALGKLARAVVIVLGLLVVLQSSGYSLSGVLAFGGIGGIAVGFAAKDLLANFFGGFMVFLDRPFAVGDWIRSPDKEIEGTVEYIGWRQTRIRTFDKRPLYVPNATFGNISVENPSRMSHRRIFETLGVRYQDAGSVRPLIVAVREMLETHEAIDERQTLIVNLNRFGPSSLDFFIYAFTHTTDWVTYHQIKEDVMLRVMDLVQDQGAEVAFPTRRVLLGSEGEAPLPTTTAVTPVDAAMDRTPG